jgi:hypothetical protein
MLGEARELALSLDSRLGMVRSSWLRRVVGGGKIWRSRVGVVGLMGEKNGR